MSKAEDRAYECFPNEDIDSKKARFENFYKETKI